MWLRGQVGQALLALFVQQYVHLDLKWDNVVVRGGATATDPPLAVVRDPAALLFDPLHVSTGGREGAGGGGRGRGPVPPQPSTMCAVVACAHSVLGFRGSRS